MSLPARTAIEALRAGVPNRAAVRLMGTEEPALEQAFDEQLHTVWSAPSQSRPGLGISGGFGSGKSHFLGYLSEVARAQGFVVSRVVVSKETPLSDPARVFEAAVRAAVLPDRYDDAITGALSILRQTRDKMAALEIAVERAGDSLAPLFSALVVLMGRETPPAGFARHLERFLAGGKIRAADIKQALTAVGVTRKYDLRPPAAALLVEQRIQFLSALFHAAGFTGWCLLFDEVELIGRYTPLRRALAYSWLATWLGLEQARAFPGIVAAYAITDDFVAAVIHEREDAFRLTERLRLKDRHREADLAAAAIQHIIETVGTRRLRAPVADDLAKASLRLAGIYRDAYDWEPPLDTDQERLATRTMRQYVKAWITGWDMRRLTGVTPMIVAEEMAANYAEDDEASSPSPNSEDDPG